MECFSGLRVAGSSPRPLPDILDESRYWIAVVRAQKGDETAQVALTGNLVVDRQVVNVARREGHPKEFVDNDAGAAVHIYHKDIRCCGSSCSCYSNGFFLSIHWNKY